MTVADFDEIEHRLPFILTTEDLPKYQVDYLGRQKVDDLDTYVFDAGPKTIAKNQHYFKGRVWVDQQDSRSSSSTAPPSPGHPPRPRRPAAALHHLLRADRRQILVPHLHQGRRHPALRRPPKNLWARTSTCATSSNTPTTSSSAPPAASSSNGQDITNKKDPDATTPPPKK